MERIKEYYSRYLGIEGLKSQVLSSKQREIPLNKKYYYSLIGTPYEGRTLYSVAPGLYKDFKYYLEQNPDAIEKVLEGFNKAYKLGHNLRKMYRMTYDGIPLDVNPSQVFTEELLRTIVHEDEAVIEKIIERNKEALTLKNRFWLIENNQMAASAKVTDLDFKAANIAVYTDPQYRGKGYGKLVVDACVNWCLKENILPIYLVETQNIASFKLAKSLGFEIYSTEWILSIERD